MSDKRNKYFGIPKGCLQYNAMQCNAMQCNGLLVTPHRGFSELIYMYKWIDLIKLIYNMVTYKNKFVKKRKKERKIEIK